MTAVPWAVMATMTNRLQVLIDDDRLARLEEAAAATGAPVAELIRRAIDEVYPPSHEQERRREAVGRLLAAPPAAVEDWDVMKRWIRDELSDPDA